MLRVLCSLFLMMYATLSFATSNVMITGTVRIIGNEPKTVVVLDTGKEMLEFSSMYQESMKSFQSKKITVEAFYIQKVDKPNSIIRSKIGVVKILK